MLNCYSNRTKFAGGGQAAASTGRQRRYFSSLLLYSIGLIP